MFENPGRGRQVSNFTTNVPKILDLKSSSEQIFFRKLSLGAPAKFKNSYFNRIVEMWNSLPLEIRLAPNLEAFKSNVKKFLI